MSEAHLKTVPSLSNKVMKSMKIEVISKTQDNVNFLSEKLDELNSCTTKIKQQKSSFINNTDKNNSKLVKLMKNNYQDD